MKFSWVIGILVSFKGTLSRFDNVNIDSDTNQCLSEPLVFSVLDSGGENGRSVDLLIR